MSTNNEDEVKVILVVMLLTLLFTALLSPPSKVRPTCLLLFLVIQKVISVVDLYDNLVLLISSLACFYSSSVNCLSIYSGYMCQTVLE